ncbi:MAG TPA: 3-hydroxybutyrate dehydrogenase [Bryobacteraceae bacterium]|jgi:3-hydroxybutyrate dehydrogenase|nr:3-hydroxybutyrate dehydrogenase [Bryobacteraceae bacterium]
MNRVESRGALVTGSTSGIGLGIANSLAASGYDVMLNGFGTPEEISKICVGIVRDYGVRVFHHDADLSRREACQELVAHTEEKLGRVDVLVNNAGIQHTAPIETFPADKWDAILALNLSAAFHTSQAALPRMRQHGWGRVVNIASVHGLVASINKCAYVAAKHGLIGLTKVIALETANSGITSNAVCPGWVLTPLLQRQIDARAKEQGVTPEKAAATLLAEKQPAQRFTKVEEVGALVVFLCSDAAANITGASLTVDGGWTAQ